MELVELTRLYLQQPDTLAGVIPHWQQRYPGHPAGQLFLDKLRDTLRQAADTNEDAEALLTGKLAGAEQAVRDGIMAAYYDTPEGSSQPAMRLYDSGGTPDSALAAYQQAVSNGANFVIGPLLKESVEALEQLYPLPVPVLGLNRTDHSELLNPALFQFGLAPEDEAREAARLARRKGSNGAAFLTCAEGLRRIRCGVAVTGWHPARGTALRRKPDRP